MKNRLRTISINIFLVGVIIILLLLFHLGFIAGPIRVMEHETRLHIEAFSTAHDLKDPELLNRFSLDEVYYIIKDGKDMYWFNQEMTRFDTASYESLEKAYQVANDLGYENKDVNYGVYKGAFVYTLEKDTHYIYLDMNTLEIVLEFGG